MRDRLRPSDTREEEEKGDEEEEEERYDKENCGDRVNVETYERCNAGETVKFTYVEKYLLLLALNCRTFFIYNITVSIYRMLYQSRYSINVLYYHNINVLYANR